MPDQIMKTQNVGTNTQNKSKSHTVHNQTIQAKQTTHKATRGAVIQRKNTPSKTEKWTFSQFEKAYNTPVDQSELTAEEKKYFEEYEKRAQVYLDRAGSKWGGKTKITGSMFANAARWSYLHYGKDISKVVPVEFALAQAQFESHLGMTGRSASKNPFNIGEYNNSTASFVSKVKDGDMGVAMYYHLMAEDYLSARTSDELLENFVNERGSRYQVDDGGVSDKSYEADVKKQMGFIGRYADKNGAKFTTTTPDKGTTTTKKTTSNPVETVYKKYSSGKIDMIALGTALVPLAKSHASHILQVFDKMPWLHRDNLAYVMTNHGGSALASFDKKVLQRISDELGAVPWISRTYAATQIQKKKVDALLDGQKKQASLKKGIVTASSLNVRKGAGANFGKNGQAIKNGSQITILETKNGWHRIGDHRWVSAKYVSLVKTEEKDKKTKGKNSVPTSTNFKASEFDCNDGTAVPPEYYPNVQNLMKQLEILRSEMGAGITINSSYRTPSHNKAVGGKANSQHLYAKAADIVVKGYTPKQVHAKIEALTKAGKMTQGGLGLYKTFVHYDIRGTKARWDLS
ncbi:D-Ala-D-Ala carboxypeptidase family metallohydrolase [uncultured Microscilla sp.]|uniref:D-Ala-D-Ala carboxypeptidase family metallohydrolase n=1 Tax=uncultured Microscilla sp. TaxID=432653 RepID=UPI00261CAED9|nr:D-Ala-D-Ala carboxypeptidase family metallohydrolase [uncultured Microscilla sp.]